MRNLSVRQTWGPLGLLINLIFIINMTDCSEKLEERILTGEKITGAEAILLCFLEEGVETMFGYPGGAIMPLYDALHQSGDCFRHILTRHEQGAVHAAQGFARVTGKTGVCLATSGPGATNILTGIADAYLDSTPLVCITGQVVDNLVGTDAFQETDILTISMAVTKWNARVSSAEELSAVMAKAFYIARAGRPGPVLVDITKNVFSEKIKFRYSKCNSLQTYKPIIQPDIEQVIKAADWINSAKRPMVLFGQGIILSKSSEELRAFVEKSGVPAAATLLGLSALPAGHPLFMGMLGMHGNYAPNLKTGEADVVLAIGMRFDDRVTGNVSTYLPKARIIHVDIDPTELDKNIVTELEIQADAKAFLQNIIPLVRENRHDKWVDSFAELSTEEQRVVIDRDLHPISGKPLMGQVINEVAKIVGPEAIVVTDVGQHQMKAARYFPLKTARTLVTSGGLGTMGFGLPAALGAQVGQPNRTVVAFIGDGGLQMTMQELVTIAHEKLPVKIIVLNNGFLGMVRQWQELFFEGRYASTTLSGPDFVKLADACGLIGMRITSRENLVEQLKKGISTDGPILIEVVVEKEENVFPMVPPGAAVTDMILSPDKKCK